MYRNTNDIQSILDKLSKWEHAFDFHKPINPLPSDLKTYLSYYGLNRSATDFHFGIMTIQDRKLILQMHVPKQEKLLGTVVLLHGYFDHSGHLKNLIHFLLDQRFKVMTFDLQGHGLSEGEEAAVKEFEDYLENLQSVVEEIRKNDVQKPYYLIGHSTGAAVAIHYFLTEKSPIFDKLIVLAPLIRSNHWSLSKMGYHMLSPFISEIKRVYARNSKDKDYLKFVKDDPLQYDKVPLSWLGALLRWYERIQQMDRSNRPIYVIQGDRDQTVDWKYNLKFLKDKFPESEIYMVKDGKHHLVNEEHKIKKEIFGLIQKILRNK